MSLVTNWLRYSLKAKKDSNTIFFLKVSFCFFWPLLLMFGVLPQL